MTNITKNLISNIACSVRRSLESNIGLAVLRLLKITVRFGTQSQQVYTSHLLISRAWNR